MSAQALVARLREAAPTEKLDFPAVRAEIHVEFSNAVLEEDRVLLLDLHKRIMDLMERSIAQNNPQDLETFQGARQMDYRQLLVAEAEDEDGKITPPRMLAVLQREITAGRLDPSDELVRLATQGGPAN